MIARIRRLFRRTICSPTSWALIGAPLSRVFPRLEQGRYGEARDQLNRNLGSSPRVQSGPFAGMVMPEGRAYGSMLQPKLLGTYECELHPTLHAWRNHDFLQIVDVGCAEGYYAGGLGLMFPHAAVMAIDINPDALGACQNLAHANGIRNRLLTLDSCSPATLLELNPSIPGLLVCDCEGYERELLTPEVWRHLSAWCFIVELHEPLGVDSWSSMLAKQASSTHSTTLINSRPEAERLSIYQSPLVSTDDTYIRDVAFAEHRPDWMHWLIAEPKESS